MRYVSVFSGVEAATLAWEPLGWEPLAFCEVDQFPSAVLASRWPNVPNLGDITKVDWGSFVETHGRPDLVVGGSPCQSFSIAGKREGLQGASGLMFEYIRCVRELMPRWFLWENVRGALSSEGGAAFGQLLREMDGLGYGLAWRLLDAQFFGVAQRRERLFLVGHLGDMRSCEVLFEPESMRWDTPQGREKRKALAAASERGYQKDGDGCLNPADTQSSKIFSTDSVAPTLTASARHHEPKVFSIAGSIIGRKPENGGNGEGFQRPGEPMYTLTTVDRPAVAFATNQRGECRVNGDGTYAGALTANQSGKQINGVCQAGETCEHGQSASGAENQGG